MQRTPTLIFLTLAALLAGAAQSPAQGLFSKQGDSSGSTSSPPRSSSRVQIGGQSSAQSLAGRLGNSSGLGALSKMITSGVDLGQNQQNQQNQGQGAGGPANRVGVLSGTERFLRENRRPWDFVGASSDDASKFVGAQTSGEEIVAPAVEDLPPQAAPNANSVNAPISGAGARAQRPYEPRMAVGFEVPAQSGAQVNAEMARRLKAIPGLHPANRIEVSVEAGIATLRGEVASERDRALSGELLLFEPGISEVRNALTVKPPDPSESRPAVRPPSDQGWRPRARR
jgi:hypothetical protein